MIRSVTGFGLAPAVLFYGNRHSLWFRRSFRWMVNLSHHLWICAVIFAAGTLISYDLALLFPYQIGLPLHLFTLICCTVIYWSPLLLRSSFQRPLPFIQRFVYLILTTMFFFIYHEAAYSFHNLSSSLTFMTTGTLVMILYLYLFISEWTNAEKKPDRFHVKGYFEKLTEK
ncbi:hypothetical protein [Halobacillus litoralis]|uniref:hypothetical protein n=1 Tax=Halobacillus litoralis TaxID=45668 RepID=UPI001CFD21D9|nr:hypothetical protein [Halobacillus litoralis]